MVDNTKHNKDSSLTQKRRQRKVGESQLFPRKQVKLVIIRVMGGIVVKVIDL